MLVFVGAIVVVVSVVGGYALPGGHLAVLFQPFEFLIILGAALGALITSNTKMILAGVGKSFGRMLKGPKHKKDGYGELLSLLHQLFKLAKSKGNLALEKHIENPQ